MKYFFYIFIRRVLAGRHGAYGLRAAFRAAEERARIPELASLATLVTPDAPDQVPPLLLVSKG